MKSKSTYYFVALLIAMLSFSTAAQTTGNATLGQTLYFNNCAVCHGVAPNLDANAKSAANNGAAIRTAISNVNQMQFFRGQFTTADTNNIAAYIGTVVSGSSGGGSGGGTTTANVVPSFNPTDLWYNASESGWGLMAVQHTSNIVVFTMYNYDASRAPLWFITSGAWTTSTVFTADLFQSTGTPFNSAVFTPNVLTKVGTFTFTMSTNDNATISYTVNGSAVSKAVTRLPY